MFPIKFVLIALGILFQLSAFSLVNCVSDNDCQNITAIDCIYNGDQPLQLDSIRLDQPVKATCGIGPNGSHRCEFATKNQEHIEKCNKANPVCKSQFCEAWPH